MSLRLYPKRPCPGQDLTKEVVLTVPQQSLTLAEIIRRYVRHQPIPVSSINGVYCNGLGDLEKLDGEDLTVKAERVAELRTQVKALRKAAIPKPVESPSVGVPPKGDVTGNPVVGQAPPASPPA